MVKSNTPAIAARSSKIVHNAVFAWRAGNRYIVNAWVYLGSLYNYAFGRLRAGIAAYNRHTGRSKVARLLLNVEASYREIIYRKIRREHIITLRIRDRGRTEVKAKARGSCKYVLAAITFKL